jgi:hypothetical protein
MNTLTNNKTEPWTQKLNKAKTETKFQVKKGNMGKRKENKKAEPWTQTQQCKNRNKIPSKKGSSS